MFKGSQVINLHFYVQDLKTKTTVKQGLFSFHYVVRLRQKTFGHMSQLWFHMAW